MERRISLRQAPMHIKEKEVPEEPEIPIPFPDLVRVPIFGIEEGRENFEFEWPQPGDIHPNMLTTERITQIKFLANNYDLRGVQVKLSNGFLSPIFEMIGNTNVDAGDRVPGIVLTDVSNEDIRTARAGAYREDCRYMKRLTLLDEDGDQVANFDDTSHENARYEVDVPPNLNLVGIYGNIGGDGPNMAIWGFGLLFY